MMDIAPTVAAKFRITSRSQIATFVVLAQHFSRALVRRNFTWFNGEPAPIGMSEEIPSASTIACFRRRQHLHHLAFAAMDPVGRASRRPDEVWEKNGSFVARSNLACLARRGTGVAGVCITARATITQTDPFMFTLGLTESWWNSKLEYEYPLCPGAVAEEFSAPEPAVRNQEYPRS